MSNALPAIKRNSSLLVFHSQEAAFKPELPQGGHTNPVYNVVTLDNRKENTFQEKSSRSWGAMSKIDLSEE